MATPRVFISHASADAEFATRLSDDLRALGADVWLDSSHMGAGDFVARINVALADRDVVALVLSPTAVQSPWVNREVNAAIARENQGLMRPLVVVTAQACDPSAIPPLWTTYHRYDGANDYPGALLGVARELGLAIPQPSDPVAPLAAAPRGARAETPVKSSWVALAAIAAFTVYALGGYLSLLNHLYPTGQELITLIALALISQLVGGGVLWSRGVRAWDAQGRRPSHPWLAAGVIPVIILLAAGIYADRGYAARALVFGMIATGDLFALIAAALFAVILLASMALAGKARQWRWLLCLLIPLLSLPLILAASSLLGESNLPDTRLILLLGYAGALLFISLAFALVGPARRAQ
jgi:hypothetical protein